MTDPEYCTHEIRDLASVGGGTRRYPDGEAAFLSFDDDFTVVTITSSDRTGLAAALRRAAAQIEGVAPSPFNLPPVTISGDEFLRQATEGK